MNLVSRLQTQYGWIPNYRLVLKKPVPAEPNIEVPQTTGISGWIVLSHENGVATCSWITNQNCHKLKVCIDERLFGDTIFRAEKVGNYYVISDVYMYNSSCIFMVSTFKERYEWTCRLMERFFKMIKGFDIFYHKSNMPETTIKGYEVYSNLQNEKGSFIEEVVVHKTDIPDVYKVNDGYLLVPDLKTSIFLRSKGEVFKLKCKQVDENWECQEDIPELK